MADIEMGTVYDWVKKEVQTVDKPLSKTALREKKANLEAFMRNTDNYYYMLLCRERNDYTIFRTNKTVDGNKYNINVLIDEVADNRGTIKRIEKSEDGGAIEIWISIDDDAYCYMFFPCDMFVIDEV